MSLHHKNHLLSLHKTFVSSFAEVHGKHAAQHWFSRVFFEQVSSQHMHVVTPSLFFKSWIEEHYGFLLQKFFQKHHLSSWSMCVRPDGVPHNIPNDAHVVVATLPPTFESFVRDDSNAVASGAAQKAAEVAVSAFNPLFVWGNVGLGKTHLLKALAHRRSDLFPDQRIIYMSAEMFRNTFIRAWRYRDKETFKNHMRSVDMLLVDDLQFLSRAEGPQTELLHILTVLLDNQKQLVFAAHTPPYDLIGFDASLTSRLMSGLVVQLKSTSYALRLAILKAQRHFPHMPENIVTFLARRIRTNVRELLGVFTRLWAEHHFSNQPLTVNLAKKITSYFPGEDLSLSAVQQTVAHHFHVRFSEIIGPTRVRAYSVPRHIAMYLCHTMTDHSLQDIAQSFGKKDHTSVLYALKNVKKLLINDSYWQGHMTCIESMLNY